MKVNLAYMKNKNLNNKFVISYFALGFFCAVGFSASAQQLDRNEESDETKSRAHTWAIETSLIAGGANYCKIDPELIESYITRAQTRIAAEAHGDEVELVVARIAFTNGVNTASVTEPKGGCEGFAKIFERENLRLD